MKSYFSPPNNTKYLVPSQTVINPSTLSNLIFNGFAPIKVLQEYHKPKYFRVIFHLIEYC